MGIFLLKTAHWCTAPNVKRNVLRLDELSSSQPGADHSGSLSSWKLVELKKKLAQHKKTAVKLRMKKNCVKGLEQHHIRIPPISQQVNVTACARGGECQRQWYWILDTLTCLLSSSSQFINLYTYWPDIYDQDNILRAFFDTLSFYLTVCLSVTPYI